MMPLKAIRSERDSASYSPECEYARVMRKEQELAHVPDEYRDNKRNACVACQGRIAIAL